jgi:hypothetical protein
MREMREMREGEMGWDERERWLREGEREMAAHRSNFLPWRSYAKAAWQTTPQANGSTMSTAP